MTRARVIFRPIGVIRTGHKSPEKTPIQPVYAAGCCGRVHVLPQYAAGLRDIEGFSHIYLLYVFHKAKGVRLTVKPFMQDVEHGVFATRAPARPNPVGISIVRLIRRQGNTLHVDGVDVLDGTPLLDVKPYTAKFDVIKGTRNGWQDEVSDEVAMVRGRRGYRKEEYVSDSKRGCGCRKEKQVDPGKCSAEQVKKCHGGKKTHPCKKTGER